MKSPLASLSALVVCTALAGSLHADILTFHCGMTGAQEVPPVATAGGGFATVTLDTVTGSVSVSGTYSGLKGSQSVAHIHGPAPPGMSASPIVTLTGSGGTSGSLIGSGILSPGQVNAMIAGLHYINVHSSFAGNGEIRGQICLPAASVSRNPGSNPNSYSASAPLLGSTLNASVNLNTTGHTAAFLFAFDTPITLNLGGGQQLLCIDLGGSGELLTGGGLAPSGSAAGIVTFTYPVPNDASLCSFRMHTQALHVFGVVPFALSNAQDMTLGF